MKDLLAWVGGIALIPTGLVILFALTIIVLGLIDPNNKPPEQP